MINIIQHCNVHGKGKLFALLYYCLAVFHIELHRYHIIQQTLRSRLICSVILPQSSSIGCNRCALCCVPLVSETRTYEFPSREFHPIKPGCSISELETGKKSALPLLRFDTNGGCSAI